MCRFADFSDFSGQTDDVQTSSFFHPNVIPMSPNAYGSGTTCVSQSLRPTVVAVSAKSHLRPRCVGAGKIQREPKSSSSSRGVARVKDRITSFPTRLYRSTKLAAAYLILACVHEKEGARRLLYFLLWTFSSFERADRGRTSLALHTSGQLPR